MHLLVDSGPPIDVDEDIAQAFDERWHLQWPATCADCALHQSALIDHVHARSPTTRMGLLTYASDPVLTGYLALDADTFDARLAATLDRLRAAGGDAEHLAPVVEGRTARVAEANAVAATELGRCGRDRTGATQAADGSGFESKAHACARAFAHRGATIADRGVALTYVRRFRQSRRERKNCREVVFEQQRGEIVAAQIAARGRHFDAALDNLTVLRQVGEEDGITRWAVHRAFRLGGAAAGDAGASPPR